MNKKLIIIFLVLCFTFVFGIHLLFCGITKNVERNNYYILTYKYTKRDLKKIKIGVLSFDDNINIKYNLNPYVDFNSLIEALKSNEVGAIILEESFKDTIDEYDSSLLDDLSVLDKFQLKIKNVLAKDSNDKFIVYICGVDTYGDISKVSRNDVNILGVVNLKKRDLLLISIPRDYFLPFRGNKDKLTHIGIYGMNDVISTLENLIQNDINYYIKVNFSTFIDIIDLLGGIDVYSDQEFTTIDGHEFHIGYNGVSGTKALSFVRERNAFSLADKKRGINSEEIIKGIINKIGSSKYKFEYGKFLSNISGKVDTNISEAKIISLIENELINKEKWNIMVYNLNGTDSYEYTYTYPQNKLYVMLPDKTKNIMIAKINEVIGD